jgi:MFS family permease
MIPRNRRAIVILALVVAGETIFLLPFVLARIFRPTFLDVFRLTNLQLGTAFALYGFVAMVSYFLGGPLADRFSARKLMTLALVTTSAGGALFATVPSLFWLTALYGVWGLTTILLFWAALIRTTREWGGIESQGVAYGLLDGGRGLFAALLASISVWVFALLLPEEVSTASYAQRSAALKQIIWIFTFLVLFVALLVWVVIPENKPSVVQNDRIWSLSGIRRLVGNRSIWLQALIVICAYSGYKATDDFSLFASDAFGYDDVAAARLGTISFWVRPFAAVGAGILADRTKASTIIMASFAVMLLGSSLIAIGVLKANMYWALVLTIVATGAGIYALRGIYFSLIEEAQIPMAVTGSAVGLVSVMGFTPDIFMGPLMGYLIDRSPGALGHQHLFWVLSGFAIIGFIATVLFRLSNRLKN